MTKPEGPKSVRKKVPNFAKQKRAFNSVISRYIALAGVGSIAAANLEKTSSKAAPNPAKPNVLDFKSDVELVIEKIIPPKFLIKFWNVYMTRECQTDLELERLADKIIGPRRHGFEQRLGAEFVKRKIYPVQAVYFNTIKRRGK